MAHKYLRRRIKAQLFLIVIVLIAGGVYFWMTNFHVCAGLPEPFKLKGYPLEAFCTDNEVYFCDDDYSHTLCRASLDGMHITHRLGVRHVKQFTGAGDIVYALCDEDILYMYDMKKQDVIKKLDLRKEGKVTGYYDFKLGFADEKGVWLYTGNLEGTLFLQISPNGDEKMITLKEYQGVQLVNQYKDRLIFFWHSDKEAQRGTYLYDMDKERCTKISACSGGESRDAGFVWNDELILSYDFMRTEIVRIKLDGSGEKKETFDHGETCCMYGDTLYSCASSEMLYAYNLATGEKYRAEAKQNVDFAGKIDVTDGKLAIFRSEGTGFLKKTKIYFVKLSALPWEKVDKFERGIVYP